MDEPPRNTAPAELPSWAVEMIALYESGAASQFILYGNVYDRFFLTFSERNCLGSLPDFFLRVLMPRFDIVLGYDIGNGVRVEKGGEAFSQWPPIKENPELPKQPRTAVEFLTRYFRYCANLARISNTRWQIGCLIKSANLLAPAVPGSFNYDLNSLASLMRDWADDALLSEHTLVTCLITENLNDLHPMLVNNPKAAKIKVPLPTTQEIARLIDYAGGRYSSTLANFRENTVQLAAQLTGTTNNAIESLLKLKAHKNEKLAPDDLVKLKKQLVEEDCQGLIEFIESRKSLDDLHGQEKLKAWLRQDIALWRQNDLQALPMGYLICGPVGTGKTYMVECLAGEAGVPVVKIKNFRDKWVGSSEGNLEKIFRLLQALSRCFVFIDEADQALGRRGSGDNDSGLSGRIYSMIAAEMSRSENRGKIIWVLASSRPDLIEVDLKRPGRVDVKIPIFPTSTPEEGFALLDALCKRYGVVFKEEEKAEAIPLTPILLTPGAAEAIAVNIYRLTRVESLAPLAALKACLGNYQSPIPADLMNFQIGIATQEASYLDFVPAVFRKSGVLFSTEAGSLAKE
jgi:hypothetical protein